MVDHAGDDGGGFVIRVRGFDAGAVKDGLARVGVGGPLVERKDGGEFPGVGAGAKLFVGDEVEDGEDGRVARVAAAEMPAGFDGSQCGSELNGELRELGEEIRRDFDNCAIGRGNLQVAQKYTGDPLVDEDAASLRVACGFDDVERAVRRGDEVSLGAATHFPYVSRGANGHAGLERDNLVSNTRKDGNPFPISMADESKKEPETKNSKDEVALELMKFIAVTTGYGKGASGAGFGGKAGKTAEEYAESLLELFDRCRKAVNQ